MVPIIIGNSVINEHRVFRPVLRCTSKQIFFKTSTSRQSELVRLVLAGIAPIRNP